MARMGQVLPQATTGFGDAMGSFGETVFGAQREKRENKLAADAYMGNPEALQELAQANPELAMQVEDQAMQRQQRERQGEQHEAAMEANRRKFATENRDLMQNLGAQIGAFDDFELAKGYADEQFMQLENIMGEGNVPIQELTPEAYEQFRELHKVVTGEDWERSGGPVLEEINGQPTYVQKFVNPSTRDVASVPLGAERAITGWDVERRGDIKQTETREKTKEERLQENVDLALDAASGLPDLDRAMELLNTTSTGGLDTHINMIRQYFGDNSMEVADLGELQTLLANDLIDKFSLMTGVLSESDMKLLRSMSSDTTRSTATNIRLLENLRGRTERKILRGLQDARDGGRQFEIQRLQRAAEDLGLSDYEIETGEVQDDEDTAAEAAAGEVPSINTQAEFDALPSGAVYIDSEDGKRYKKP
ncbi:MAG: hypothetical protein ACR2PR_13085 [Pseudohongiellaceae bacterium]